MKRKSNLRRQSFCISISSDGTKHAYFALIMKVSLVYLFVLIILLATGCQSAAPVTSTRSASSLPSGETEVVVFCSGPEFFTTSEVFRASAVGESMNMSVAKRKAMTNARSELAASIQSTVRGVTDSYVNSLANNNQEKVSERYESLTREVVNQNLKGLRVICERYTMTAEGNYKVYVAIELSAQNLVDNYYQQLTKTQSQTTTADYENLQKRFAEEMVKTKKN
jgi:hypothetical protein